MHMGMLGVVWGQQHPQGNPPPPHLNPNPNLIPNINPNPIPNPNPNPNANPIANANPNPNPKPIPNANPIANWNAGVCLEGNNTLGKPCKWECWGPWGAAAPQGNSKPP